MALYSIRGYARYRGVTHVAVMKAIATQRIPKRKDGRIDSAVADRAWAANTDIRKPRNAITGNPGGASSAPPPLTGEEQLVVRGMAAAMARKADFESKTAELRYQREAGLLVPIADIRAQLFRSARGVRESLETIEDRLAPVVAGLGDVEACRRAIHDEIQRALSELRRLEATGLAEGRKR